MTQDEIKALIEDLRLNHDTKMKRFKQGEEFAKKKQDSRNINDKNQVFIYSKALSRKK